MNKKNTVLICTSHFHPNVGGVETHLNDLVVALARRKWNIVVAAYKPLARDASVPFKESKNSVTIYRMPWIGFNIVHLLTPYPPLEFIYLFPGLFAINLYALLKNNQISVIHSQGLVPGVVGIILGKLFRKRVVVSTHNLYFFPKTGMYTRFSGWILSKADCILTLSNQSAEEMISIGIPEDKVKPFRYWLDLSVFKPMNKDIARRKVKHKKGRIVFFVGRLIETKGVKVLLEVSKLQSMEKINYVFAGLGPLQSDIEKAASEQKNVTYVGPLKPEDVRLYMNATDIVAVPSTVDEGYGRVAMEAIACGTPVLAAKKGGLNEVITKEVGWLEEPNTKKFADRLKGTFSNKKTLSGLSKNTRTYALKNFSEENVKPIIKAYQE